MHEFNYNHSTSLLVASIPLVIALVLLIPLVVNQNAITIDAAGFKLSPVRNNMPIIFSLLAFMLGYITLIGLFLSKDLKEWFLNLRNKQSAGLKHVSVRKRDTKNKE